MDGKQKQHKHEREKLHIQNSNRVQTSVLVAPLSGSKDKKNRLLRYKDLNPLRINKILIYNLLKVKTL